MKKHAVVHLLRSPAFWVVAVACGLAFAANMSGPYGLGSRGQINADERPSLAKMAREAELLREGALLTEIKGRFRKEGERYFFTDESGEKRYKCLENFCLQRVASAMQGEERKLVWLISAKITEFNEENFLLLEKAVRTR
jgi:hypothetical protein